MNIRENWRVAWASFALLVTGYVGVLAGLLDRLPAGEALTLVNDHDPMPLRYQLEATGGHGYRWDYLEADPQV